MSVTVHLIDPSDRTAVGMAARLLDDFNTEFDTPTPGVPVIADRLERSAPDRLFVLVATADGVDERADIGIAVVSLRPNVWFDGPVALLDELYVRPAHRNRGVGTHLLAAAGAEAARRGVEHLEIAVDEGDVDARRFYERHGFGPFDLDSGDRVLLHSGSVVPT
ncbi:MAG: GNAT family N-acetyltransferase [Ilumatobacteraceae bacterium]